MKSVIRLILVSALLNLAAGASAMAEPAEPVKPQQPQVILTEDEDIEDEMAAAKRQMKAAEKEMDRARKKMESAAGEQEVRAAEREMGRAAKKMERAALRMDLVAQKMAREREIETNQRHIEIQRKRQLAVLQMAPPGVPAVGARGRAGGVLVIPDEDMATGQLLVMMEDMSIMSRIIEKKLAQSHLGEGHAAHFYMASVFDRSASGIRSIYLDGYGALFLSKVDFPLSAGPKAEEQGTNDGYDPLWEQARQEIYRAPEEYQPAWSHSEKVPEYDAEKVEELKRKLIRTLKHAANIRRLDGGDWIVISITGSGRRSRITTVNQSVIRRDEKIIIRSQSEAPTTVLSESCSPTVLTIRASKSDVDEFAEGDLDFAAFRERVQIFTY